MAAGVDCPTGWRSDPTGEAIRQAQTSSTIVIPPISTEDLNCVERAQAWLDLNLHAEAMEEISAVSPGSKEAPLVLAVRMGAHAMAHEFEEAALLAEQLRARYPELRFPWSHGGFLFKQLGQIQEAHDLALEACRRFPRDFDAHYQLATYACALWDTAEACAALSEAFRLAGKAAKKLRAKALADADLEPLWPEIQEL